MACNETVRGVLVVNAGVNGVGTQVNISSLFAAGALKKLSKLTVYNDADKPVRVSWTNDSTTETDNFIVPHGGKSFTHKLATGNIMPTTLNVSALGAVVATGNITINLEGQ